MSDTIALFRAFIRVVEAGSFTRVAAEQNSSQPTVSRQIAALEEHLGARLFTRTTRRLTLTDDGRSFYERARLALEAVGDAEESVGRRRARPSGTLRLACPVVFGRLRVIPHLKEFFSRYTGVSVDLVMNDGYADLVEEGIDLAIRSGEIPDTALIAKRIASTRRVVVAAPSYLRGRPLPAHPPDLAAHDCIAFSRAAFGVQWPFESPEGPISFEVKGRFRTQNSEGTREAVMSGLGIGLLPIWHFTDEIETGRVVVLLQAYEPKPAPIHVVYPSRRLLPRKTRVMIDFLERQFASDPKLNPPLEGAARG
ncbi:MULTISPECIES: LysR substrate-binding domain-containing protein [Rhodopseudomonas]|uniref:LysR family transcriptional regulator n=1 Tax=Rhodopseudomonas palustris TaxID=1076 RepID=A0A0D7EZS1_RHOPL|nr:MULTISPECIES: LysR substrate-binding domain-containing protein [Rhodopseudomonas]KIZ46045.1 LysR family transcriptional regulator [Rhodopseudomonas palustris]MDF3809513.1 LysR substrate-binding domain-containing protein [Rhodopseudomonas sp. BAL398]WOK19347.1 LysR substrate-binding domain-containing protein [Rhodopseudomonas sp. BAL398]